MVPGIDLTEREDAPMAGLPSIATTCTPRPDVLRGVLSDDHFAAQLDQIVRNPEGYEVYGDPNAFFAVTYPTEGLRRLLESTFARLAGKRARDLETGCFAARPASGVERPTG
jgi:hypothetical protein